MKKKIVALVLAAGITMGMGGFGTYSAFTDQADVTQKISITAGTFDIDVSGKNWETKAIELNMNSQSIEESEADSIAEEERIVIGQINTTEKQDGLTTTNVKPGDYFTKKVTISNKGTLDAKIKMTLDTSEIIGNSYLELSNLGVTATQGLNKNDIPVNTDGTVEMILPANTSFEVKLKLQVSKDLTKEQSEQINGKLLDNNIELVKVKAEQLGLKETTLN